MILLEREKLLSELEQKIGYSFRSRALMDRALTHRSFANERVRENCQHNEAMEFLGDSVLGFVVSAWLLERFPDLSEGKLSKMKAYLVSESRLVELAEELDLGSYILLNRGEEKTGGRRKRALLADAYEALIGVLYVDGGITVAERFLRRELRQKLNSIDPASMIGADYKSALQERLQAGAAPGPEYVVVGALGPDHRRTFQVQLRIGGANVAMGEGHTIKLAQQEAARVALESPGDVIRVALLQKRRDVNAAQYDVDEPAGLASAHGQVEEISSSAGVEGGEAPGSKSITEDAAGQFAAEITIAAPESLSGGDAFRREASLEMQAEGESDREARSVTSDV